MAYTYLWDAPYLDFSRDAVITYKQSNTSDELKPAQFSLVDGNALLSFENPGSYKVYATDKGIKYERTITLHKSSTQLEGSGLSAEEVEQLKREIASQVTESIQQEPYVIPKATLDSIVQEASEQVLASLPTGEGGNPDSSLVYNGDGTFTPHQ